jgi:hypothetical protein
VSNLSGPISAGFIAPPPTPNITIKVESETPEPEPSPNTPVFPAENSVSEVSDYADENNNIIEPWRLE